MPTMTIDSLSGWLARHARWLKGEPSGGPADLTGQDLSGLDIAWANLDHVVLNGARLVGLNEAGLTTTCLDPKLVTVTVREQKIVNGQLVADVIGHSTVPMPVRRVTDAEFITELDRIVAPLPKRFQFFVKRYSIGGDNTSHEDDLAYAQEMTNQLGADLESFRRSILTPEPSVE